MPSCSCRTATGWLMAVGVAKNALRMWVPPMSSAKTAIGHPSRSPVTAMPLMKLRCNTMNMITSGSAPKTATAMMRL